MALQPCGRPEPIGTNSSTNAADGTSHPVQCNGIRYRTASRSRCDDRLRHCMTAPISYQLAFGTYADALRMVGVASEPRTAGTGISAARIQMFAATVHDGNPSYWDAEYASRTWGGLLAPPALLMGWLTPPPWQPDER